MVLEHNDGAWDLGLRDHLALTAPCDPVCQHKDTCHMIRGLCNRLHGWLDRAVYGQNH